MFELAIKLIHIEAQVLVENAYNVLEIESNEVNAESYNKGTELSDLKDQITTDFENQIFEGVEKLFPLAPLLASGFFDKEIEKFFTDPIIEHDESEKLKSECLLKLELNLTESANKLEIFSNEISKLKTYDNLLSLDKEILKLLIRFEEFFVERQEFSNECIDGSTGGHHRDALDVYLYALNKNEFSGQYVYFSDNGELSYSPLSKYRVYMR